MEKTHVVIVTGLSGSGRSTAIKALEDIGFYCIDNLPIVLLDKVLLLAETHQEVRRIAIGVDIREKAFLGAFEETVGGARAQGHRVDIVFLEASDEALIRRFSETRRRHPLLDGGIGLSEAIVQERQMLMRMKAQATHVVDTTLMNVHQLKGLIQQMFSQSPSGVTLNIVSFGYRYGLPREADYVFDCRFLPNPFFVEGLQSKSGSDEEIKTFLRGQAGFKEFLEKVQQYLLFVLPMHEKEGRPLVTIAFGCTGGRHRSVATAEEVAGMLKEKGFMVRVSHRDVEEAQ